MNQPAAETPVTDDSIPFGKGAMALVTWVHQHPEVFSTLPEKTRDQVLSEFLRPFKQALSRAEAEVETQGDRDLLMFYAEEIAPHFRSR